MENSQRPNLNKISQEALLYRLEKQIRKTNHLSINIHSELINKIEEKYNSYKKIISSSNNDLKKEKETKKMILFLKRFELMQNLISKILVADKVKHKKKKSIKIIPEKQSEYIKNELRKFLSSHRINNFHLWYRKNNRIIDLSIADVRAKLNELYGYERNHSDSSILRIVRTQGYALDTNSNKLERYIKNNRNFLSLKDIKDYLESINISITDSHIRFIIRKHNYKLIKPQANLKTYLDANKDNLTLVGIKAFLKSRDKTYSDAYIKKLLKNYKYKLQAK